MYMFVGTLAPNRSRHCRRLSVRVSSSRSTARSKPNARVRTSTARKSSTGGGRGSKSASEKETEEDQHECELLSCAHATEMLEECSRLLLFSDIFEDPVVQSLLELLEAIFQLDEDADRPVKASVAESYREYFARLAEGELSWADRFLSLLLSSDNVFSKTSQVRELEEVSEALVDGARHDLAVLHKLFRLDPAKIAQLVSFKLESEMPAWTISEKERARYLNSLDAEERFLRVRLEESTSSWADMVAAVHKFYSGNGSGMFPQHLFFLWDSEQLELEPVQSPDDVSLDDILGNRRQKKVFRQNVDFLLAGLATNHILLTGRRGSGKSSIVKAFVNSYGHRGLRLVEVNNVLDSESFRELFLELRNRTQKFLIFIDDFNYDIDEEEYRSLRRVLDGTCMQIPSNVMICVTSCRFGDPLKGGGASDADMEDLYLEDIVGFSDRFGTLLTFDEPTKEKYLETVKYLAEREGVGEIGMDILELRASQFAKARGGFCGRTARHFVKFLTSEQSFLKSEMNDCRSNISRINEMKSSGGLAEEENSPPDGRPEEIAEKK